MSKPVSEAAPVTEFSRYSEVAEGQREECLRACREMTDALYEGLDLYPNATERDSSFT